MGIVIGIDVGISTTKIVGLREGRVLSPIRITAADQITSLYGAFGKYLHDNKISLNDVEQVMLTGVGSAYINEPIHCRRSGRPFRERTDDSHRRINGNRNKFCSMRRR